MNESNETTSGVSPITTYESNEFESHTPTYLGEVDIFHCLKENKGVHYYRTTVTQVVQYASPSLPL